MADRSINLRLSLKDGEVVRRALMSLGADGERALQRIEKAGVPASRSLLALDTAVKEARSGVEMWAARAGPAGSILQSFGAGGLAAAAGIGVAFAGMAKLLDLTRQTVDEMDALKDASDKLGVSVETLQELRFAGGQAGLNPQQIDQSLDFIGRKLGDVARGSEEARQAFGALGVSAFDAQGKLKTIEQILPEIADGFARLGSQEERLRAAQELFGRGNTQIVALLQQGSAAMDRQRQAARELGAVLETELVTRLADTKDELAALETQTKAYTAVATADLAPALVEGAKLWATLARWIGETVDNMRSVENMTTRGLVRNLEAWRGMAAGDISGASDRARAIEEELFRRGEMASRATIPPPATQTVNAGAKGDMLSVEKPRSQRTPAYAGGRLLGDPTDIIPSDTTSFAAGVRRGLGEIRKDAEDVAGTVESALTNAFSSAEDALVQFATTGKLDFRSLAQSILADLARIQARMIMSSLFGGAGSLFGGGGPANIVPSAPASSFGLQGLYHGGGNAGSPTDYRWVPRDLYNHAPRLHSGLMPDEFPAILQRGERVLSRREVRGGAGAAPQVNVIVNNNAGVAVSQRQDEQGSVYIDIEKRVNDSVRSDMASGSYAAFGIRKPLLQR